MIDKTWLSTCATAGEFLYGEYSVSILRKLYESKKGFTASADELIPSMKKLQKSGTILMEYLPGRLEDNDADLGFFVPVECEGTPLEPMMKKADADGNPYASLHLDEDERVHLAADAPENLDYYIPTEKEITQLVEEGYIRTSAMTALENKVHERGGNPEFLKSLWSHISTDKLDMMEGLNAVLNGAFSNTAEAKAGDNPPPEIASKHPTMDDINVLMPYINDFLNNVNLRGRKGWRPNDLHKKMYPNGMTSMPTLVPGSVQAAKSMKEAEA